MRERSDAHDPADAFGAVANEIRIDIVRAFVEEQRRHFETADGPADDVDDVVPTMSFAELREAVGLEDSGRFAYHLDQLRGRYVRETEEGYLLTWAGLEIAGSILAGGYGTVEIERQEIDRTCPSCGSPLEAVYEAGFLSLFCTESEDLVLVSGVPAGAFEGRSLEEAADLAVAVQRRIHDALADGYCPLCYGSVEMAIGPSLEQALVADGDFAYRGRCGRCANVFMAAPASQAMRHPAVVAFYHEHGIDLRDRFSTGFEPTGEEAVATLRSEDPLRIKVTFEIGDDQLRVVMDEGGDVIETDP